MFYKLFESYIYFVHTTTYNRNSNKNYYKISVERLYYIIKTPTFAVQKFQ